tara:strand:- start:240 stop:650 length:411 start_codon:yes stop_codon:yes gene_type:complete
MKLKIKNSKRFILSKKYLGKGLTIIVSQGFKYNHDDLFKNQQHRFLKGGSASHSWDTQGIYTTTRGYPAWASGFVSEHRLETTKPEPNTLVELNQKIENLRSEMLRLERKYDSKAHISVFIIIACIAIALYLIQTQ